MLHFDMEILFSIINNFPFDDTIPISTIILEFYTPIHYFYLHHFFLFQVTWCHPNLVEATILTGVGAGEVVFIPRIPISPTNFHIKFQWTQFPLTLSFAMTINKYVACSRVTSKAQLHACTGDSPLTKNIVYQDVVPTV